MIPRSYKVLSVVAMAAALVALLGCSEAELVRLKHHPAGTGLGPESSPAVVKASEEEYLSFLVVGDWGRKGLYNQSLVAAQMGKVGEKHGVEFIISTGDNFYENGLTGVKDPAFLESFSNIYTAPSLQKKWYNVLGNHDYRGDAKAQLSRHLRKRDRRWVCQRSYILEAGRSESVDIFMVDTTPFVDKYFTDPGEHKYDWRDVTPRKDYLSSLMKDLNSALKESSAKWKIVVGHHTIFSAGHHGSTDELLVHLLPILKENNVDVYLNGHDHCLERISKNNIEFVTSGGGSKAWRGDEKAWDPKELKFYYDGQGFLSAQLNSNGSFIFQFYDVYGQLIHHWEMSKQRPVPAAYSVI